MNVPPKNTVFAERRAVVRERVMMTAAREIGYRAGWRRGFIVGVLSVLAGALLTSALLAVLR